MISGTDITDAIEQKAEQAGWKPYDPDAPIGPDANRPTTMRELIAFDYDSKTTPPAEFDYSLDGSCREIARQLTTPRTARSARPIATTDLTAGRRRCPPPFAPPGVSEHLQLAPLCRAVHLWCELQGVAVYIDHDLDEAWPMTTYFFDEAERRSGFGCEVLFPQSQMEYETGEAEIWDYATLPLYSYCNFYEGDTVPLIEFFQAVLEATNKRSKIRTLTLPEAVNPAPHSCHRLQAKQPLHAGDVIAAAEAKLRTIVRRRSWSLLSAKWAAALKAIDAYPHDCMAVGESWEANVSLTTGREVEQFLVRAEQIGQLRQHTDELVRALWDEQLSPEAFWADFLNELLEIGIRIETGIETKVAERDRRPAPAGD